MKNLLILNGPNLNMVGKREPTIYGKESLDEYLKNLINEYSDACNIEVYQSNYEGDLISRIQDSNRFDGIIINAGGLSHTSISLHDAILSIEIPVIEVHISNTLKREEYRHIDYVGSAARGTISGCGLFGYNLAVNYFINNE